MERKPTEEEIIAEIIEDTAHKLQSGETMHVIPNEDCVDHTHLPTCPCQPKRIFCNQNREIWLHKIVKDIIN